MIRLLMDADDADIEVRKLRGKRRHRIVIVAAVLAMPAALGSFFPLLAGAWFAVGAIAGALVGPPWRGVVFFLTLVILYLSLSGLFWAGMVYFRRKHLYRCSR